VELRRSPERLKLTDLPDETSPGGGNRVALAASAFIVSTAYAYFVSRSRKPLSVVNYSAGAATAEELEDAGPPAGEIVIEEAGCQPAAGFQPAPPPARSAIEFHWSPVSRPKTRSRAFLFSLGLHCAVCFLGLGVNFEPETPAPPVRHYSFRLLQLNPPLYAPGAPRPSTPAATGNPGVRRSHTVAQAAEGKQVHAVEQESPQGRSERRLFQLPPEVKVSRVEHTLLQPDLPILPPRTENMRVPDALVWSLKDQLPKPTITPAPATEVKALDLPPTLDLPERDAKIVERLTPAIPAVIEPRPSPIRTATSPVRLNTPEQGTQIPETVSRTQQQKSSGHLISVADTPLPPEGLIAVPPVSQAAPQRNAESPASASPGGASDNNAGRGAKTNAKSAVAGGKSTAEIPVPATPAAKSPDAPSAALPSATLATHPNTGSKAGTAETGQSETGKADATKPDAAKPADRAANTGASAAPNSAAVTIPYSKAPDSKAPGTSEPAQHNPDRPGLIQAGPAASDQPAVGPAERPALGDLTRIQRPPDGRHSSVVLGLSTPESYPESAGVLSGRVVYTVYLQVGLPKSWILQFCQTGGSEPAKAGGIAALNAPWPFVMIRPGVSGLNGDYTLVHGLVNTHGRFEQLGLVVPDEAAKKELLGALQQWEFRPATRDGQPIPVEILLIIPHRKE
jgi:hypothetical protein